MYVYGLCIQINFVCSGSIGGVVCRKRKIIDILYQSYISLSTTSIHWVLKEQRDVLEVPLNQRSEVSLQQMHDRNSEYLNEIKYFLAYVRQS